MNTTIFECSSPKKGIDGCERDYMKISPSPLTGGVWLEMISEEKNSRIEVLLSPDDISELITTFQNMDKG